MRKYIGDVLVVVGCALLIWGTYQICPMAAPMVAGLLAIAGGIVLDVTVDSGTEAPRAH